MATRPRSGKSAESYRTIGKTYDGIAVVAPKTKSKRFTEAESRDYLLVKLAWLILPF